MANYIKFQKRTGSPGSGNKYYTRTGSGGWNDGIAPKYSAWSGSALHNCVPYARGRFAESQSTNGSWVGDGASAKTVIANLPHGNANKMYGNASSNSKYYQKRGKGSGPVLGAIACFNYGTYGHVIFVEAVYSNGNIDYSASNYSGSFSYKSNVNPNTVFGGTLQGYIVPNPNYVTFTSTSGGSAYIAGTYTAAPGSGSNLNMRSSASTSSSILTKIPNGATLNVTSVSGSWGKTTYGGKTGWVALWYCKFVKAAASTSTSTTTTTPKVVEPPTNVDISGATLQENGETIKLDNTELFPDFFDYYANAYYDTVADEEESVPYQAATSYKLNTPVRISERAVWPSGALVPDWVKKTVMYTIMTDEELSGTAFTLSGNYKISNRPDGSQTCIINEQYITPV